MSTYRLLGQVIVIPDKGMPQHQYEGEFGNLYVELQVVFPAKLSEDAQDGMSRAAIRLIHILISAGPLLCNFPY